MYIYVYKWSKVIHDTQSDQISQKQDGRNIYIYIYIYIFINIQRDL